MAFNYEYPWIANISQILPLVKDRHEFIVAERDYGIIINYVMQTSDTFPDVVSNDDALLRECRGIVFDKDTGKIIARRLEKFFNYGEKMYGEALDISRPHVIMEKVDGSMITPIYVDGKARWGTKMGITEIGLAAETFVYREAVTGGANYIGLAFECESLNATPIFEYCSTDPDYQVVVRHEKENLILLHIRDKITGKYYARKVVEEMARPYGVPCVATLDTKITDMDVFQAGVLAQSNTEGVIVQFDDGHMVKVKTDWYLALHRAKAAIEKEKDVALIIINDSLDDMLPLQPPEMQQRLCQYRDQIVADLDVFASEVARTLNWAVHAGMERRDFALATQEMSHGVRSACFAFWEQKNDGQLYYKALEWAKEKIAKACGSNTNYQKVGYSILKTARWHEIRNAEDEGS
jgi:RNA ligase